MHNVINEINTTMCIKFIFIRVKIKSIFMFLENQIRTKPIQNLTIYLITKLVKHCLFTLKSNAKLSTAIIPLALVPEKVPEMIWKVL